MTAPPTRDSLPRLTPRRVRALAEARRAGSDVYGAGLAGPGPTLLLELALARIEARPLDLAGLPEATGLAQATLSRWLGLIESAGLAARLPAAGGGGERFALTGTGEAAMGLVLTEEEGRSPRRRGGVRSRDQ